MNFTAQPSYHLSPAAPLPNNRHITISPSQPSPINWSTTPPSEVNIQKLLLICNSAKEVKREGTYLDHWIKISSKPSCDVSSVEVSDLAVLS